MSSVGKAQCCFGGVAPLLQPFSFVLFKLDFPFRFKRKELAEELQKRSDSLSKLEVDR